MRTDCDREGTGKVERLEIQSCGLRGGVTADVPHEGMTSLRTGRLTAIAGGVDYSIQTDSVSWPAL